MSDVIVRRIHKLSQELTRVPYLSEFVRDIDPDCYQFMYVRQTYPSYDDFVSTLYEMAISANDSFNDHFRDNIRQLHLLYPRRSTIPLKLKSKLYINRADRRAYYVDKDEIRHVCGSIFQWLLQGNKQVREKMTLVTKWIPAMYKNLLNDAFDVPRGDSLLIIKLDVSGFTNSCVNTWLLVLTAAQAVKSSECVQHLRARFDVRIGDAFLSVSVLEILELYLYTTVGATSSVNGELHVSPGGYLGVKGNMNATSLFFAAMLEEISTKALTLYPNCHMFGQIGGDDAYIRLTGTNRITLVEYSNYVHSELTSYVGHLKEFICEEIVLNTGTMKSQSAFCKKEVYITVSHHDTCVHVVVQSAQKLPLMTELIVRDSSLKNVKKLGRGFRNFIKSIRKLVSGYDEEDTIVHGYATAWATFYDFYDYSQDTRRVLVLRESELVFIGRHIVTHEVHFLVQGYTPLLSVDTCRDVRGSIVTKLKCLEYRKIIKTCQVLVVSVTDLTEKECYVYVSMNEYHRKTKIIVGQDSYRIEFRGTLGCEITESFNYLRECTCHYL